MAALIAADYVLIPIKPAPFALEGLKDVFDTIRRVQKRLNKDLQILGIIFNLVEGRKTTIGAELEETLRSSQGDLVFKAAIHKAVRLEESPSFNQSIMEYDPRSKAAEQFDDFVNEFLKRLGN